MHIARSCLFLGGFALLAGCSSQQTETPAVRRTALPTRPPEVHEAGTSRIVELGDGPNGKVKLELVWIPPGSFMMGSPTTETPRNKGETQHRVTLTQGYWMGKCEVTQEQWLAVMGSDPFTGLKGKGRDLPACDVSWNDSNKFAMALNTKFAAQGGGFRLPTEAEWEYACRAGTTTRFYWGDDPEYREIADFAWYKDNSKTFERGPLKAVGGKRPNAWGLYDMLGNVAEWCQDWWEERYSDADATDPLGPSTGVERGRGAWDSFMPRSVTNAPPPHVIRGGSCDDDVTQCRSASRAELWTFHDYWYKGLRVVRD